MNNTAEISQLDSPLLETAESNPDLERRLSEAIATLIVQARTAKLKHFRYCSRRAQANPSVFDFERRLSELECELQETQPGRGLETAILERLQLLGRLSHAPRDLPYRKRIRFQALVRDGLDLLR